MPKTITFDRNQVIEDVMELFWQKGYNGTSMQDLVDVTGLNRSSFYNTFGDKFSLFKEALKHYQKRQDEMLQGFVNGAQSPKGAIVALFKGISSDITGGNQKGCMLTSCTSELAGQDERVRSFLSENMSHVVQLFSGLILAAQQAGEISADKNADILALYLFSSLQGLRVTSILDKQLEEVVDQVLGSL
ncbi:TetR/AcrR family transcriptional regulator [Marinoscillum sp.]|uniref:TetR/AcrR family transcriptional regulator n=1 Tax=Marinoscillum sp. TaxID=2024838 RepID=UPI003BA85D09